jgi:hypothetical protein
MITHLWPLNCIIHTIVASNTIHIGVAAIAANVPVNKRLLPEAVIKSQDIIYQRVFVCIIPKYVANY